MVMRSVSPTTYGDFDPCFDRIRLELTFSHCRLRLNLLFSVWRSTHRRVKARCWFSLPAAIGTIIYPGIRTMPVRADSAWARGGNAGRRTQETSFEKLSPQHKTLADGAIAPKNEKKGQSNLASAV